MMSSRKNTHSDEYALQNVCKHNLAKDILSTPEFKRLGKVSFLGAIDLWLSTKSKKTDRLKSNRFDHSIGVLNTALRIIELDTKFPESEIQLFIAAALLHDIGHAPLSHSIESVFEKRFGINHHTNTNEIISDSSKNIYKVLKDYLIYPSDVILTLDRKVKPYFSKYMNNHFNVDTLDGIYRSYEAIGKKPDYSLDSTIKAMMFKYDQVDKNIQILDHFWKMKELVYNTLIYDGLGRIADEQAQLEAINEKSLRIEDFGLTDDQLTEQYPQIKSKISEKLHTATNSKIYRQHLKKYRFRYFRIRPKFRPSCQDEIKYRYYQEKQDWTVREGTSFLNELEDSSHQFELGV